MRLALLAAVIILPACAQVQPIKDCRALQAEVTALRARVKLLEAANTVPAARQAVALPGTAAKPAAKRVIVIEEPYSRSGCRQSLFKGMESSKWQDADAWLDLEKGQQPAQAEALLGPEHYDERGGNNVIWYYGKCGASSKAQVLFTKGRLAGWRAPAR